MTYSWLPLDTLPSDRQVWVNTLGFSTVLTRVKVHVDETSLNEIFPIALFGKMLINAAKTHFVEFGSCQNRGIDMKFYMNKQRWAGYVQIKL